MENSEPRGSVASPQLSDQVVYQTENPVRCAVQRSPGSAIGELM